MIVQAISSFAVTALLVVLTLALLLLVLPLFERLSFDLLCQEYVQKMDAAGGLSGTKLSDLASTLRERGFTVKKLTAPANAPFGGDLTLTIQATKPEHRIQPNLSMKAINVNYNFSRTVTCRKIETAAGEQ